MGVKARLVVKGEVQGVGYRWFVRRAAQLLGVSGWVRNVPDGTVEVVCEARDKKQFEDFVEQIRRRDEWGPRVDDIVIENFHGPVKEGFEIVF